MVEGVDGAAVGRKMVERASGKGWSGANGRVECHGVSKWRF